MSHTDDDFQDFREAVSEHTSHDEAAQQIKLARTCLEMGMPDEAIAALTEAAAVPRHRFEACVLLARLYRERGDLPRAIEWFEHASGAPAPSAEEGRSLVEDLHAARAAHKAQG